MKRWIQLVLLMSLAFNFGFLGSLVYRLSEKSSGSAGYQPVHVQERSGTASFPRSGRTEKPVFRPEHRNRLMRIRENFRPRVQGLRQALHQERRNLEVLLQQASPDSIQIDRQLERINELQLMMDREIVFELIREAGMLPPDQRMPFIQMALKRIPDHYRSPNSGMGNRSGSRLHRQSDPNNQRRNKP